MLTVHKMTLLALLTAAAVAGRLAIHGMNIQPATLIIILTGWFFGWKMGAAEGMLTALASDLFLGLGYWTLFHLAAWGMIGLLSALIPHRRWLYYLWLFISGFLFGIIMAFSYFVFTENPLTVVGLWISGLPFDLYHAAGNLIFGLVSPLLFKVFANEANKLRKHTAQ
ncbi:ECF transporter S component [Sporolactobacillus shoreae]|uniref:ECF transporter S component n=1 Tax=Sporolactobacillus shoreae TaxID=1465501 RepID=A0A4Z0GLD3_9BACL|nr:ECF transporter S component [Sporolactobacillus shoreae]TGA96947.1 ECF transporter S component [Sporolactobacillus shoreae]